MKKPGQLFVRIRGTILIFSLVVILGGTLVLVGWAQMMATRANYTVMTEEGQKRRIAIANGRALARQYVLTQMPSGSIPVTNYGLANGWGGFAINFATNFWTNTNFVEGNPFNPFSGVSFVVTNSGTLTNDDESYMWTFFLRSRSPLLSGYSLTVQNPGTTNLAWASNAYKIFWTNVQGYSNFPSIPFTSGANASGAGTNAYIGYFASPMNTNYPSTTASGISYTNASTVGTTATNTVSTNGRRYTNYTGGRLDIVLNSAQTNNFLRYDVPNTATVAFTNGTNITTYSNAWITNIILTGSATATNVLHLIADTNNTNLTTVTLRGTNNTRRVYLNKSGGSLDIRTETVNSNYSWWMGMTVANSASSLTVYAPTNSRRLTMEGGIRSDRTINVNQGNLSVISNTQSGTDVDLAADRILWLEEQRTP